MKVYEQALAMARRSGDPLILASTLVATLSARWQHERISERIASADEAIALAQRAGNRSLVFEAAAWRMFDTFELGDIAGWLKHIEAYERGADELREPFLRYVAASSRTMHALFEGRLDDAERLAQRTLEIGDRMPGLDAAGVYGVQMFTLRREQGRLAEVGPMVQHVVQTNGQSNLWRPGLALIYTELGQLAAARAQFDLLAADGFRTVARDGVWVSSIAYLAQVCSALHDVERAPVLYSLLQPYSGRNLLAGTSIACLGAADALLGSLAATLKQWALAERHFVAALAMNERQGARPALAHTRYQYAAMLMARHGPADRHLAAELLQAAADDADRIGMRALAGRIAACRAAAGPAPAHYPAGLSEREAQVLCCVAAGKSNRQIAQELFVSPNTVANHVRSILSKTQSNNRTEAAAFAIRHALPAHATFPRGALARGCQTASSLRTNASRCDGRRPTCWKKPSSGPSVEATTVSTRSTCSAPRLANSCAQQRVADTAVRVLRIDADRVDDRHRFGAAEVAQVGAGHDETDDRAVEPRGQRDADRRIAHGFVQPGADVAAAIASGDGVVDAHDLAQVFRPHGTHFGLLARQPLVVVGLARAEIDLAARSVPGRHRDRRFVRAAGWTTSSSAASRMNFGASRKPMESSQCSIWSSRQPADVRTSRMPWRRAQSDSAWNRRRPAVVAARVGAHADHLQPQPGLGAAELALEHARQDVAGQALGVAGGELRMQLRLAQGRGQAALDVVAARAALDGGVDGDHGREIVARQRADGERVRGGGCRHGGPSLVSAGGVGERQFTVVRFVEQVVEQRQQRHGFLLDVRDLAFHQLERVAPQRAPAGLVDRAGGGLPRQRQQLGGDFADRRVLLGQQRGHAAVAGIRSCAERAALPRN